MCGGAQTSSPGNRPVRVIARRLCDQRHRRKYRVDGIGSRSHSASRRTAPLAESPRSNAAFLGPLQSSNPDSVAAQRSRLLKTGGTRLECENDGAALRSHRHALHNAPQHPACCLRERRASIVRRPAEPVGTWTASMPRVRRVRAPAEALSGGRCRLLEARAAGRGSDHPMARIGLAPGVPGDIDRFIAHLEKHRVADVANRSRGFSRPFRSFRANR
ncbi:hypothetical protein QFZ83_002304 [Variovorax sp. W1I1]|nr:hypothetical protein [Variovorax sp. W1I1]